MQVSDFGSQASTTDQPPSPAESRAPVTYAGRSSGPRAGFWRRVAAVLIDGLILGVLYGVLLVVVDYGIAYLLYIVANYTYYTLLEGGESGQTVGKRALGIRVIDFRAGGPIGYGRGLLRNIAKLLSGLVFGLGYLWMLWDSEKQTWHDKLATTVVVPVDAYPVR
jgi:uncharacterized RDD family membrane protein YckC